MIAPGKKSSLRIYNKDASCVFFKTKEQWGEFSNMSHDFPYLLGGAHIITNEHLYQALKFQSFPYLQKDILSAKTAKEAKSIARLNVEKIQDDKKESIKYMRYVLFCKYKAYTAFFDDLFLKSDNNPIVEMSYKDEFWGAIPDDNKLIGINALGRLWMEVRENRTNINNLVKSNLFSLCSEKISYESEVVVQDRSNQIRLL
ncbi:NADAR family protein [Aeromonas allosaccharophila]